MKLSEWIILGIRALMLGTSIPAREPFFNRGEGKC